MTKATPNRTIIASDCEEAASKLYSTKDAATYLGVKEETVKYHVYTSRALHPTKVGKTLVFAEEELDRFRRDKRPPHRPRKSLGYGEQEQYPQEVDTDAEQ